MDKKDIQSIVINYEDGTSKTLEKGMVITAVQEDDEVNMSLSMCGMSGTDVLFYMRSVVQAYAQMVRGNDEG